MTTYSFIDESGETRLVGTISPAPGGGSQSVKAVDLGIIDLAALYVNGPTTLYTMQAGEFLSTVRFTDTDFVDPDVLPLQFGIGTVKSFGWWAFANAYPTGTPPQVYSDTLGYPFGSYAYDTRMAALGTKSPTTPVGMVLSAAAGGNVQAAAFAPSPLDTSNNTGNGIRYAPIVAWHANTAYGARSENTPATPGALCKCAIVANGTVWTNSGASGTSGGSSPDFTGGSPVSDGPDIIWNDETYAMPTVGSVHAVAEIWTPA